jgi:hypothetical protein
VIGIFSWGFLGESFVEIGGYVKMGVVWILVAIWAALGCECLQMQALGYE